MNKKQLIEKLKPINPLRSTRSWNKASKEFLQELYDETQLLKLASIKRERF